MQNFLGMPSRTRRKIKISDWNRCLSVNWGVLFVRALIVRALVYGGLIRPQVCEG